MVGILGGMGPAAGADFVRLFVQACTERMVALGIPVLDQAYPEHWLAQVPVPDRTAALNDPREGAHQPLDSMLQATGRLAALGVRVVAIACNTAGCRSAFPIRWCCMACAKWFTHSLPTRSRASACWPRAAPTAQASTSASWCRGA